MDADSETRQGVLAAASANLTAVNYTLVVVRNLRIKRTAEQPEPTPYSENQSHYSEFTWS